jgi:ribosomal protein S18 acetylase RimI-like enzyme
MIQFTEEEQRIIIQTRTHLRTFQTYQEEHHVYARRREPNRIAIGYISGDPTNVESRSKSTCFDLNIIDDICYIVWINRNEEDKNQGLGRKLIQIIENLAKELGTSKVRLSPSGRETKLGTRSQLYESLGYTKINDSEELEKIL